MNGRGVMTMDRRRMLAGAAALGAASFVPARAFAQAKTLVAATFPGTWNEAHRNILAPAFRRATGAAVTQSIILGTDQVARLQAAKGSRPPSRRATLSCCRGFRTNGGRRSPCR